MNILLVLVFMSVGMLSMAMIFFLKGMSTGDYDHADEMALLPLENENSDGRRTGSKTEPERKSQ